VVFEQATIKVEKEQEFQELKSVINRVFSLDNVEGFLKRLKSSNLRVRDWDSVIDNGALDLGSASSGSSAKALYQSLAVSDQAQLRELYLSRVEQVDPGLRTRFQKLYRYY
jgi:hypothetical protein